MPKSQDDLIFDLIQAGGHLKIALSFGEDGGKEIKQIKQIVRDYRKLEYSEALLEIMLTRMEGRVRDLIKDTLA
jgi:hypothetical protein